MNNVLSLELDGVYRCIFYLPVFLSIYLSTYLPTYPICLIGMLQLNYKERKIANIRMPRLTFYFRAYNLNYPYARLITYKLKLKRMFYLASRHLTS